RRLVALRDHEGDGVGAGCLDVRARRVEMGVVGHEAARPADDREQDVLCGARGARGVAKGRVLGTPGPGPPTTENRIFSAARPWWVGMTCRNGNSAWTLSRKANQDGDPAELSPRGGVAA